VTKQKERNIWPRYIAVDIGWWGRSNPRLHLRTHLHLAVVRRDARERMAESQVKRAAEKQGNGDGRGLGIEIQRAL
jgi:hypothetical protein